MDQMLGQQVLKYTKCWTIQPLRNKRLLGGYMHQTKTFFCWLMLGLLTLTACSDEQERGRKWCRKAAQVAGSLCLEGRSGAEGDVRIRVFGTTNVTQVNLSELGGSNDAPRDGTPNSVNPGTGKVFWNSTTSPTFLASPLTPLLEIPDAMLP